MKNLEINQALLIAISVVFLIGLGSTPLIGLSAILAGLTAFKTYLNYKSLNNDAKSEIAKLKADMEILNSKMSSVENKVSASGLRRSV